MLLNTASYRINLEAMRASLQAGCHYLDLGGLYRTTLRQLELSAEFERAGRLAVLGIGSSPGKTNLMAAEAVRRLVDAGADTAAIDSIDVFAAGRDPAAPRDGRLRPPYAIQTLLDELTLEPVVLRDGRPERDRAAQLPAAIVDYGEPIGPGETIYTLHSELATFGESFGCRSASFRLSLAPALLERLKELAGAPPEEVAARRRARPPRRRTRPCRYTWCRARAVRRRGGDRARDHPAPLRPGRVGRLDRHPRRGVRAAVRPRRADRHRRASARALHRAAP